MLPASYCPRAESCMIRFLSIGRSAESTLNFSSRMLSAVGETGGSIATSANRFITWFWIMSRSAPALS